MTRIEPQVLNQAMNYHEYRTLVEQRYLEGTSTSGEQTEAMLHYTSLNMARMDRLDKKDRLTETTHAYLQNLSTPSTWLVLTEGWCGDAAQVLPVIHKMAEASDYIELKIILRDQ
ncbi:MAG: thioredoxin family protein, partial [Saprospiraceae bacterium]|nr:thioredoxin family protein [Saprospiraceae bacterium]